MDKDFADVIKLMVREQGKEVLVNGKAKIFLADYCEGRFVDEADIFRRVLDAGCGEHINNADSVPELKLKLMERLEGSKGLSPRVTAEYLDLLGLILRGTRARAIQTCRFSLHRQRPANTLRKRSPKHPPKQSQQRPALSRL